MTYDELTTQAVRLPPSQRLALIEALTRSLRTELTPRVETETTTARLAVILRDAGPTSSLHRLLGVARPDGAPPTDEEL